MPIANAAPPAIEAAPVSGQVAPNDYAVVIANQDYMSLNDVPYAIRDADAFASWLTRTRGLPAVNVMRVAGASRKKLEDAVSQAARLAPAGGTLWVYYAGHGLGLRVRGDTSEQVLVGINAIGSADELPEAVVPVAQLEAVAAESPAAQVVFVLDACFNNRDASGAPLVRGSFAVPSRRVPPPSKVTVWTASSEDETAQWYDVAKHGAFTYFAVGALSGWADGVAGRSDGAVTLDEAQLFVSRAMAAAGILGQSPQVAGPATLRMASGNLTPPPSDVFSSTPPDTGVGRASFGFNDTLSAELASQSCDEAAQRTADAQQRARAQADADTVRAQATQAWSQLEPQLVACEARADRAACISAVEQYIVAGRSAMVTVPPSRVVVKTACGDRARAVAAQTVAVSIGELAAAEAKLSALKRPFGGVLGQPWTSPTVGAMKWIPAGTFTMGSPASEANRSADEVEHSVTLSTGYWMMATEVTQATYSAITGRNPAQNANQLIDGKDGGACSSVSGVSLVGANLPAMCVTWEEATLFANAVSARDGLTSCYAGSGASLSVVPGCTGYRLPTEAEWERAARGASAGVYAGTTEISAVCGVGNVADAAAKAKLGSNWRVFGCDDGTAGLAPVGRYRPNAFGLFDMTGNVWEWTFDGYHAYDRAATDPIGRGVDRVRRGGGWNDLPEISRLATRLHVPAETRDYDLGFRLVRSGR